MKKANFKLVLICLVVTLGFIARLLPHPANFTPIAAVALFAGLYFPRRWAVILPLMIMFLSDLFIGFYDFRIMMSVYVSFAIMGLIGLWARKRKNFATVLGGTLLGSIVFFLITNAAICFFGTMYDHSLTGLSESYTMAIPFFRNSLLGDLFYVGLLVGGLEFIYLLKRKEAVCTK